MQIYRIYNKVNNKSYIGATRWHFKKRYSGGRWWDTTHSIHLKKAVVKYGLENFDWEVLWEGESEDLDCLEKLYINQYSSVVPNGYNSTIGAKSGKPSFTKDYELIDCFGNFYQINNLSAFCEKYKLNYVGMLNMVSGRWPISQGYALSSYLGNIPNPNEEIFVENIDTGEIDSFFTKNSSKWSKKRCLDEKIVRSMIRGKVKVHRQWKLCSTSLEDYPERHPPFELEKDGEIIKVDCIYRFAKDNGIDRHSIYNLKNGKALIAHGYVLAGTDREKLKEEYEYKRGREAILISPDGQIHNVKNIRAFCRKNKLNDGGIYAIIAGRIKSSQGWKLKKL